MCGQCIKFHIGGWKHLSMAAHSPASSGPVPGGICHYSLPLYLWGMGSNTSWNAWNHAQHHAEVQLFPVETQPSNTFTFSLKGSVHPFSLAYPHCQNHYSCTLGPYEVNNGEPVPPYLEGCSHWLMGWWGVSAPGWFASRAEPDGTCSFYHATWDGAQFNIYALLISEMFCFIFSAHS